MTIYIDEVTGADEEGRGAEASPYKSLAFAYQQHPGQSAEDYLVRKAPEGDEAAEWKPAAKAGMKKAISAYEQYQKKQKKAQEQLALREKQDSERQKVLEEAKKVVLEEDTSLPKAVKIKLNELDPKVVKARPVGSEERGTRVRVLGRVDTVRDQKHVIFVTLRDGYGWLQCVLTGNLTKTYDALTLERETSMELFGEMREVPEGAHAPDNRELQVDYYKIHPGWQSAGGDEAFTNRVAAKETKPDYAAQPLLDIRHLALRHPKPASIMLVRDAVEFAFHTTYKELQLRKVSPPALVQTQVEGGSTLFKFDYYGEEAYLTQSSQLYLETCLPSMGDVYCIEKSFRAEKSLTRRHLSEYTHIEAELDFITFDDLLSHLETVMCRVIELTMADPLIAAIIMKENPGFKPPQRPFMRMKYSDAIEWLRERGIKNEDGNDHVFGDDIAEAAERKMTDEINRPIFLTHFPVEIKAFYMQKDKQDPRVTESVDCLMPGVGEIVGGSMRMDDYDELMAAYKREGISPAPYYWYTDQRKYGSSPHGGYGLGFERFLAWLCNLHTVREACLYPRYMGRCTP